MEIIIWYGQELHEIPSQDNPFNTQYTDQAIVVCDYKFAPGNTYRAVWAYNDTAKCPEIRGLFSGEKDALLFANAMKTVLEAQ